MNLTCIENIKSSSNGEETILLLNVQSVERKTTRNGDPYYSLSVLDLSSSCRAFIWADSQCFKKAEEILQGCIIKVRGRGKSGSSGFSFTINDFAVLIQMEDKERPVSESASMLSSSFAKKRVVFDIETVPQNEWDNLPESIAGKIDTFAKEDQNEREKVMSLSPLLGKTVCIAFQDVDDSQNRLAVALAEEGTRHERQEGVEYLSTEEETLQVFWELSRKSEIMISFNGKRFDVPFLTMRSAILGIPCHSKLTGNRFSIKPHLDLRDLITDFGMMRGGPSSLDMCCHAFGIATPKGEMDGSKVAGAYRDGKIGEIAKYNLADVKATMELFLLLEATVLGGRSDWSRHVT